MRDFLILLRPHHYIKNLFIFLPLFFTGQVIVIDKSLIALLSFISFSLSASAVYIFNDYNDIQDDKKHPLKKNRPLASGSIKPKPALLLMIFLFILSFSLMAYISIKALIILFLYVALNIIYSLGLKKISLVDITIIAIGFVLRLFVGSFAYNEDLKIWIVIMTFLLALFIALAKRRDDILIFKNYKKQTRKSIIGYNIKLIDSSMVFMSAVIVVAYIQFSTSAHTIIKFGENLYLTSFYVIFGIMRYMQITFVENRSGSPVEILLSDKITIINLILWLLSFAWIIYF